MSRKPNGALNIQPRPGEVDRSVQEVSQSGLKRRRAGLLRRRRDAPAPAYWAGSCPACGLPSRDLAAARLGFCDRCREFTGMCGAGRRIICPDMMTRTTWHTPCTELGTVAWDITLVQGRRRTVLCGVHDAQVRFGGTPWIVAAVALDQGASRRPWQSASA